jgi:hypothetical protein
VAVPSAAWAVATAATPHTGAIPTAVSGSGNAGFGTGSGTGGFGGGGAPGGGGGGGGFGGAGRTNGTSGTGGELGDFGGFGEGAPTGRGEIGAGGETGTGETGGTLPSRTGTPGGTGAGFGGPGPGGATSSALVKALEKTTTRWAAAVEGSNSAASLELASGGKAVMAMGGFTGTDPAPTLAEFEKWADAGDITYYIAGGGTGGGPGGQRGQGTSSQITSWVESHFKSTTIGGETVYLLLQPKS